MLLSSLLYRMYAIRRRKVRELIRWAIKKMEKGEIYSETLRRIFLDYHHVNIGMYTHGGCFFVDYVDPDTTIGRYCSIADGVRLLNHNHSISSKSSHAFFFNPSLKIVKEWHTVFSAKTIGNDVWIGHNAIVLPSASRIGDGAIIAAGAVVNKDVPDYGIVVGNPARLVRFRFSHEQIEKLAKEKWWEKSIEEIARNIDEYTSPCDVSLTKSQDQEI